MKQTYKMQSGQFTIIGVIMVILTLMVLGALMPAITQTITDAKACVTGTPAILLDLIPVFLVVGIIMSIVIYATAPKDTQNY